VSDALREAIEFTQGFVADEHAARQAAYLAPDDASYEEAERKASEYLLSEPGSIVVLGFDRSPDASGAELFHPRALYLVARHRAGDREVFRAFVSSPTDRRGRRYGLALNIASVGGELKIVGETAVNVFESEETLVWEPAGGDQFDAIGPPEEVAKLQRPSNPVHAAHFDSYEEAA
jgi:hypothetical protein